MTTAPTAKTTSDALAQEFVAFALSAGVLRFGEFRTKAGRLSPYFFNAGGFDDGAKLGRVAEVYARRLLASGLPFDMLFGPAYKGIPLATTVAVALAAAGRDVPVAFNRKEAKAHGEGGAERRFENSGAIGVVQIPTVGESLLSSDSAEWRGEKLVGTERLGIRQLVTIPADKGFMLVEVRLTNSGSVPIASVEYMRGVDPDQGVTIGGSYATLNWVEYQPPRSAGPRPARPWSRRAG